MSQDILIHTEAGVCTITLNRVDKKNSITSDMYAAMADALATATAEADAAVRVVVFQGDIAIFSAGNDIGDFLNKPPAGMNSPVFRFLHNLAAFPKPVWRRSAARPWASAPRCCSIAIWSTPVTTQRFPCPL